MIEYSKCSWLSEMILASWRRAAVPEPSSLAPGARWVVLNVKVVICCCYTHTQKKKNYLLELVARES